MCDFLNPHQKEKTFQVLTPQQKTARALIWTKKLIFEDFYKKIFIWERNHPDSSFSDYLWIPDRY